MKSSQKNLTTEKLSQPYQCHIICKKTKPYKITTFTTPPPMTTRSQTPTLQESSALNSDRTNEENHKRKTDAMAGLVNCSVYKQGPLGKSESATNEDTPEFLVDTGTDHPTSSVLVPSVPAMYRRTLYLGTVRLKNRTTRPAIAPIHGMPLTPSRWLGCIAQ